MKTGYYYQEKVKVFGYEPGHMCIVTTLQHRIRTFFIESEEITKEPRNAPIVEKVIEGKGKRPKNKQVKKAPESNNYELF